MDSKLTRKGLHTPMSRSESSTKGGIHHSSPFCVLVAPVINQILLVPPAACVHACSIVLCSCIVQHVMEGLGALRWVKATCMQCCAMCVWCRLACMRLRAWDI